MRILVLLLVSTCFISMSVFAEDNSSSSKVPVVKPYGTYPVAHAPVFQRGNQLSKPLAPGNPEIQAFLQFYSKYVKERTNANLPTQFNIASPTETYSAPQTTTDSSGPITATVVPFPSTVYSDVGPTPRDYGKTIPPGDWQYVTSSYCQDCHDATETLKGVNPNMRIPASHSHLFANWSPYGEWSVSLMGLSARDPVFHAQVESERKEHPGVRGSDIDNVCYSCHGPMGQRQVHIDLGNTNFDHEMIYATPDNTDMIGSEGPSQYASPEYAKYGALARDSVSCGLCHHIGPADGKWTNEDGEVDWSIFYGPYTTEYPIREGDEPGPPYPFTATFQTNLNKLYVPSSGLKDTEEPMLLLGLAPSEQTKHIKGSEYCGGCHVVIVPKTPAEYEGNPFTDPYIQLAYEQTTYFEFVNSGYPERNIECQTCHMPGLQPKGEKVVNVSPAWYTPENPDVPERDYNRHRLLGINLFVHEMFQQFAGILGLADPRNDDLVPPDTAANLLNAEQSIVQHATTGPFGEPTVSISIQNVSMTESALEITVVTTNNSGHKFPSGAGFRRGFIELQVTDANGQVLWISGKTNQFGVILGKDGEPLASEFTKDPSDIQPHYQVITEQDQVQIYEERTKNDKGVLTTQTLSLFTNVKDNRLLPRGWMKTPNKDEFRYGLELSLLAHITRPEFVGDDPNYTASVAKGNDVLKYTIDLKQLSGTPAKIQAKMQYQTIPPYYLVDRYADGYLEKTNTYGSATSRLIYLTSRLDTNLDLKSANNSVNDFNVIQNWTMTLSQDHKTLANQ